MCVNYITVSRQVSFDWFRTPIEASDEWRDEIYKDCLAPFIVHDDQGNRKGLVGSYGFVPQRHRPFKKLTPEEKAKFDTKVAKALAQGKPTPELPRIRMDTMNARAEEVGSKLNCKRFWLQQQLCIVPALRVFEPNWETGLHERWAIELEGAVPIGLPGMWRTWEEKDGTITHSFTHFTLTADDHPLLKRFHRPGEEKRGVAILRPENYDDWLSSTNPEFARVLIELRSETELHAFAAPKLAGYADDVEETEAPRLNLTPFLRRHSFNHASNKEAYPRLACKCSLSRTSTTRSEAMLSTRAYALNRHLAVLPTAPTLAAGTPVPAHVLVQPDE